MQQPTMQDVREGTAQVDVNTGLISWNNSLPPPGSSGYEDVGMSPSLPVVVQATRKDTSVIALLLLAALGIWLVSD